jgi:hypothetical protein
MTEIQSVRQRTPDKFRIREKGRLKCPYSQGLAMLRKPLLVAMLCLATLASANEAAPSSKEANDRLVRIQKKMEAPDISSSDNKTNLRNYLQYLNKLYTRADYDFPQSLANYYQDSAERKGVPDERTAAQQMAKTVVVLNTLIAGMPVGEAFSGNEYEAVRLAYRGMRAAEQGIKLSEEEIARMNMFRAEAERPKQLKLQKVKNDEQLFAVFGFSSVAVIASCLIGLLLWPLVIFFDGRSWPNEKRRLPTYISKSMAAILM